MTDKSIKLHNIRALCHKALLLNSEGRDPDFKNVIGHIAEMAERELAPALTFQQLKDFLAQPGINFKGICQEAKITEQPLYRCLKAGKIPGERVLAKLIPVLKNYGL